MTNDNPTKVNGDLPAEDANFDAVSPSAPEIEFPSAYSLKIVGDNSDSFCDDMLDIVARHDPSLDRKSASFQDSRNGRFRSLRVTITATSEEQLKALFEDLKATGRVHMVI